MSEDGGQRSVGGSRRSALPLAADPSLIEVETSVPYDEVSQSSPLSVILSESACPVKSLEAKRI